ncbi:MAG TPA: twin-arginine translocation signal domain-containing protein, partial [Acidobacteriaceae bacterium]|nr:twin-arginine translocation signal domain-containing protein [Acidobacteriaceae bacterium]
MAENHEASSSTSALSRRNFLRHTAAALAATAAAAPLAAQTLATPQTRDMSHDTHTGVNEKQLGP